MHTGVNDKVRFIVGKAEDGDTLTDDELTELYCAPPKMLRRGDRAVAILEAIASGKEDAALSYFVYRCREAGPGGHFVLGSK